MSRRLLFIALAAGFIAILAQSLLIRELVIAFLGNELVIGVTLAAWLFWTGIGSLTLGRLAERSSDPRGWLVAELLALAPLIPISFYAAAQATRIAGLTPGEIPGPFVVIGQCLLVLAPLCLANGALFPTLCRVLSDRITGVRATDPPPTPPAALPRIYFAEALGAALGGILFAAFIVRFSSAALFIFCLAVLAVILAAIVPGRTSRPATATWLVTLAFFAIVTPFAAPFLHRMLGPPLTINTYYGRTTIQPDKDRTNVFHNGLLTATYPPTGSAEPLVCLAMLQENPTTHSSSPCVLLIGGLSETADDVLAYSWILQPIPDIFSDAFVFIIPAVDIVEIDPDSVDLVREQGLCSRELENALDSPTGDGFSIPLPSARLIIDDGRRYISRPNEAQRYPRKGLYMKLHDYLFPPETLELRSFKPRFTETPTYIYESVLLTLPPPLTAELNRYYTAGFYRQVRRRLTDDGIFAFSVESTATVSTPELRDFLACLKRTLESVFDQVAVVPGDHTIFLARKGNTPLTLDADVLLKRLRDRRVKTRIFEATAAATLDPFRIRQLRDTLAESRTIVINTDLHPVAYAYALAVWSTKGRTPQSGWWQNLETRVASSLTAVAAWPPAFRFGAGAVPIIAVILIVLLRRPTPRTATSLAVATGGFTGIAVEIIALIAFQALYGYVYLLLGLILASYMIGLFAGAQAAAAVIARSTRIRRWLLIAQYALIACPVVLAVIIWLAARSEAVGSVIAAAFLAITFLAGLITGFQFPLAAELRGHHAYLHPSCSEEPPADQGDKYGVPVIPRVVPAGSGYAALAERGGGPPRVAASLYAIDLLAASLGALTVSTLLLPAAGFLALTILMAGIAATGLAALHAARPARQ